MRRCAAPTACTSAGATRRRTSASVANASAHWRNGGTFVIKGVGTLEQDMSDGLSAALMRSVEAGR